MRRMLSAWACAMISCAPSVTTPSAPEPRAAVSPAGTTATPTAAPAPPASDTSAAPPAPGPEPSAEAFDAAPEASDGTRACTVRRVGGWARVRCAKDDLLDLYDSFTRGRHRIEVSDKELTHVYREEEGRTVTWYFFKDGVYELALNTRTGKRDWLTESRLNAQGVERLLRARECCLEVRGKPGGKASVCFGDRRWGSKAAPACFKASTSCGALDACLLGAAP